MLNLEQTAKGKHKRPKPLTKGELIMTDKTANTNLQTVLNDLQFKTLTKASNTWKSFDKHAVTHRAKLYVIGKGLNVIYNDLKALGIKRDEIPNKVNEYFPDMSDSDRKGFRSMSKHYPLIEAWANKHYKKGFNASNIVKGFLAHTATQYEPEVIRFNKYYSNGHDGHGNFVNTGKDKPKLVNLSTGKKTKVEKKPEVVKQVIKKGFETTSIGKVTKQDLHDHAIRLCNEIDRQYKAGNFTDNDENGKLYENIISRFEASVKLSEDTHIMDTLFAKSDNKKTGTDG